MLANRPWKKGLIIALTGLVVLTLFVFISQSNTPSNQKAYRTNTLGKSSTGTAPQGAIRKMISVDTWNNIHPFQAFDYYINTPSAIATVAHTYDVLYDAQLTNVPAYRANNPNMILTYYIPFHRDFGIFTNNTLIHDLSYWKSLHPDWVVYKCDRVTPAYQYGDLNMPLDFTNPNMIAWQVQTYGIPASQNGYDALAPDNVDFGNWYHACGIYKNGKWVQLYSGQNQDPRWRAGILYWLAHMAAALHGLPHPIGLIPNLAFGGMSALDPSVLKAVDITDGILDEGGFTFYGDAFITNNNWVQHVQLDQYIQRESKPVYTIDNFKAINRPNMQWALASYLMSKDHSSEIYISLQQKYGVVNRFNEYNAQIGSPTNSMHHSQNVYWRDYSHGVSIVNPNSRYGYKVKLKLGVHYVDLYGNRVGPFVSLPPHSGMVLLIA
ncbi:MAG TPA: hypothetical protein VK140_06650 [Ktedonobacteraceae bacterium]|nr:hypothetical protein [Ktedonobacteraceae bacterium]